MRLDGTVLDGRRCRNIEIPIPDRPYWLKKNYMYYTWPDSCNAKQFLFFSLSSKIRILSRSAPGSNCVTLPYLLANLLFSLVLPETFHRNYASSRTHNDLIIQRDPSIPFVRKALAILPSPYLFPQIVKSSQPLLFPYSPMAPSILQVEISILAVPAQSYAKAHNSGWRAMGISILGSTWNPRRVNSRISLQMRKLRWIEEFLLLTRANALGKISPPPPPKRKASSPFKDARRSNRIAESKNSDDRNLWEVGTGDNWRANRRYVGW